MDTVNKNMTRDMEIQQEDKQIIEQPPIAPRSFDPERDIKNAQVAAKALMQVVSKKDKPIMMGGKQYLEFADWQTIAKFFNITTGTEWTKPIKDGDKSIGWEAKAIAYQNGQVIGGAEASCMKDEKNWASKPEFQLRSMAQTRAHAKALRSILGYIAVLAGMGDTPAEEMDSVIIEHEQPKTYAKAAQTTPPMRQTYNEKPITNSNDPATPAQMTLIKQLCADKNQPMPVTILTKSNASVFIKQLLAIK